MTESELQTQCLQWLKLNAVTHWRVCLSGVRHSGMYKKNPMKGMPDICGVLTQAETGRFFGLELKTKTGKLSPDQVRWLDVLRDSGAAVAVIRSIEELKMFMHELGEVP